VFGCSFLVAELNAFVLCLARGGAPSVLPRNNGLNHAGHSCRSVVSSNSLPPSPPVNWRLKDSDFIVLGLHRIPLPPSRACLCAIKSSIRMVKRSITNVGGSPTTLSSSAQVSTNSGPSTSSAQSSLPSTLTTASPSSPTPSAASSSSSSPTLTSSPISRPNSSNSLSRGAVAGIALGCLLVGALVAFGLGYCFFRRKRTQRTTGGSSQARQSPPAFISDKERPPVAVATLQRTIDNDLDSLLPQEADDNTMRTKASTLFDQFELHVENYYRDVKVSIPPAMESELSRFSSPHLSEPLVAFLNSTSRPMTLIKHSLAVHVISLTSTTGESARSLLPQELVGMARTVNLRNPTAGL
jgi:hypothetical protein